MRGLSTFRFRKHISPSTKFHMCKLEGVWRSASVLYPTVYEMTINYLLPGEFVIPRKIARPGCANTNVQNFPQNVRPEHSKVKSLWLTNLNRVQNGRLIWSPIKFGWFPAAPVTPRIFFCEPCLVCREMESSCTKEEEERTNDRSLNDLQKQIHPKESSLIFDFEKAVELGDQSVSRGRTESNTKTIIWIFDLSLTSGGG